MAQIEMRDTKKKKLPTGRKNFPRDSTKLKIEKYLNSKEKESLWLRMRKDDIFDDLCEERDKIVRLIENHDIEKNALIVELEKWDAKISTIFSKAISKDIKLKEKSTIK